MKRLLILFLMLLVPTGAWASKVALVIGNAQYSGVATLDNPLNDSRDVARALTRQGFEVVEGRDLSRTQMRDTLRKFRELADRADVALVYYAGHGIEISGRNYLVPVDARLEDERDAELEMVELDLVLGQISGAKTLKMVVLDACRNNPFVVKMKRSVQGRSVRSGLGRIDQADADTLIAYAAAAGGITPDGAPGGNSPFTAAFLTSLEGPPTDVRRLMGRVRDTMRQSVPGAAPFVYTSLGGGEFIINPKGPRKEPSPQASAKPAVPAVAGSGPSISAEFVRVDRLGSFTAWNDFLIRFERQNDHPLYAFALERREALRPREGSSQVASLSLGIDEQAKPAPTTRAEPRNLAVIEPAPKPALSEPEAKRRLQVLLKDAGCYRGAIDGILGRGSRRGLDGFAREADVGFPADATQGGDALRRAISLIEANPGTECPAPRIVRKAPRRVQPKPAAKPAPVAVAPAPVPVPRVVQQKPNAPTEFVPEGSREPRRTKLTPEPGAEQTQCVGSRRKFYNCPD